MALPPTSLNPDPGSSRIQVIRHRAIASGRGSSGLRVALAAPETVVMAVHGDSGRLCCSVTVRREPGSSLGTRSTSRSIRVTKSCHREFQNKVQQDVPDILVKIVAKTCLILLEMNCAELHWLYQRK